MPTDAYNAHPAATPSLRLAASAGCTQDPQTPAAMRCDLQSRLHASLNKPQHVRSC
ncbi:metallopeptidase [Xanthomonas citri pv. punicae]|nr:metallopeptidase [Xanthomonas citri pv. citri]QCZ65266.1 metallopeptidase [Xanthomonas citri pv. punicae]QYF45641.1 metallopeptidase [Xanthomonas citri]CCF70381.1 metallopeptidase domain protein [Xanthomonas citri pv. punicae str. LMG 859]APR14269.1 metallopeptidase [Xanthomonas citri pv. citri]